MGGKVISGGDLRRHGAPVMSGRQFGAELGAGSTHLARQAGAWNGAA